MSRPLIITFKRIDRKTKRGRNLYKLSDENGKVYGRAFTIDKHKWRESR